MSVVLSCGVFRASYLHAITRKWLLSVLAAIVVFQNFGCSTFPFEKLRCVPFHMHAHSTRYLRPSFSYTHTHTSTRTKHNRHTFTASRAMDWIAAYIFVDRHNKNHIKTHTYTYSPNTKSYLAKREDFHLAHGEPMWKIEGLWHEPNGTTEFCVCVQECVDGST